LMRNGVASMEFQVRDGKYLETETSSNKAVKASSKKRKSATKTIDGKTEGQVILENDPDLKNLIYKTGIHYREEDIEESGIERKKFLEVLWDIVIMIRHNLIYATNTEVLKKILSQPSHRIIILPPTAMKKIVGTSPQGPEGVPRGIYDFRDDTVLITWNPHM